MSAEFKRCTCCGHVWQTREEFLDDASLVLNGYQADFEDLEHGLFYFTHEVSDCCSTVALYANDFIDLNKGVRYPRRKTGSDECPGYCLDIEKLETCVARCECAFVRDLISIIKMKKASNAVFSGRASV